MIPRYLPSFWEGVPLVVATLALALYLLQKRRGHADRSVQLALGLSILIAAALGLVLMIGQMVLGAPTTYSYTFLVIEIMMAVYVMRPRSHLVLIDQAPPGPDLEDSDDQLEPGGSDDGPIWG